MNNMEKFVLIHWPWIQVLMEEEGFNENACLDIRDNAESNSYFVSEKWLNSLYGEVLSKVF